MPRIRPLVEVQQISGIREPPRGSVSAELRDVAMPNAVEREQHVLSRSRRRLEQILDAFAAEHHPRVTPVDLIILDAIAGDEIGVVAELDELAPRPEREVLAV